jgi:tetratricopeptide (TPR) repeat protein
MTYYLRRNYEEAIPHLERAVELGARSEDVCYTLGFAYGYLGQCERAIPWFEESLAINPRSVVAAQGMEYCSEGG